MESGVCFFGLDQPQLMVINKVKCYQAYNSFFIVLSLHFVLTVKMYLKDIIIA